MSDLDTLRRRVTKHQTRLDRYQAEKNRIDGDDGGDPATARLNQRTLTRHHATTDRDLARYTWLLNHIDGTEQALRRARTQLAKAEEAMS